MSSDQSTLHQHCLVHQGSCLLEYKKKRKEKRAPSICVYSFFYFQYWIGCNQSCHLCSSTLQKKMQIFYPKEICNHFLSLSIKILICAYEGRYMISEVNSYCMGFELFHKNKKTKWLRKKKIKSQLDPPLDFTNSLF